MNINDAGGGAAGETGGREPWQPWPTETGDDAGFDAGQTGEQVPAEHGVQYGAEEGVDRSAADQTVEFEEPTDTDGDSGKGVAVYEAPVTKPDDAGSEAPQDPLESLTYVMVHPSKEWWRRARAASVSETRIPDPNDQRGEASGTSDAVEGEVLSVEDARDQVEESFTDGGDAERNSDIVPADQADLVPSEIQTSAQLPEGLSDKHRALVEKAREVDPELADKLEAEFRVSPAAEALPTPAASAAGFVDDLHAVAAVTADPKAHANPYDNMPRNYGRIRKTYVNAQLGIREFGDKIVNKVNDLREWRDRRVDSATSKVVAKVPRWIRQNVGHPISQAYIKGPGERYTKRLVAMFKDKSYVREQTRLAIYGGATRRQRRSLKQTWRQTAAELSGSGRQPAPLRDRIHPSGRSLHRSKMERLNDASLRKLAAGNPNYQGLTSNGKGRPKGGRS